MPQASAEIHRVPMNVLRPALDSSRFSCSFSSLLWQGPLGPKYIYLIFLQINQSQRNLPWVLFSKEPSIGHARPVTFNITGFHPKLGWTDFFWWVCEKGAASPPTAASPPFRPLFLFKQVGILRRPTNHSAQFWRPKFKLRRFLNPSKILKPVKIRKENVNILMIYKLKMPLRYF